MIHKEGMNMTQLIELWYHDEAEVDARHSWLANSPFLITSARTRSYENCSYSKVLALTEYARPDFILTIDGEPLLSAEVTKMNPSGHNLPQRFSCLVRAAELGVPSLYYYPEYSRRTVSDANPRFLNVRVPLSQLRLSEIYNIPSLSLFWPTDPTTLMPSSDITSHKPLAQFVEYVVKHYQSTGRLISSTDTDVALILNLMKAAARPRSTYSENPSFREFFPTGNLYTKSVTGTLSIDPPNSCTIYPTHELLSDIYTKLGKNFKSIRNNKKINMLCARDMCFVYQGTPNKQETGPEHPFPGYLALLDILYIRTDKGQTTRDRTMNLVFKLPITLDAYIQNAINRPTGLNILMEFSDFLVLEDAIVLGGWMRNVSAGAVLIRG